MIHIGKTAKYVRERKGLTLRGAAAALGISHVHLSNIENNEATTSLPQLDKFREVYGVDLVVLAWCLFGDIEKLPVAVRGPMKALGEAWKKELGEIETKLGLPPRSMRSASVLRKKPTTPSVSRRSRFAAGMPMTRSS